ncbi:structural protein [Cellulophaga phage phi17:2_18]|uniref:Structural protein n=2 Tax=Lightbulbvirus Cba172 TaxID=1918525 RepID=R9ZWW0_9CAUD|nr:pectate lyase [Cellulophaga phage phi17:2]AGO47586.1 structural protein [Cellulophaga phage phi17:2]ALO80456.1 structural protein [Cellulophaga phage phi17:2_18]
MAEPIIKKENIEDLPISKVINLQDTLDNFTGGGDVYNNIFRDSSDSGLTGTIDGTNTSFTVSNGSYNPGTLNVFVEGQLFVASHGIIETNPSTGIFAFENAPETGTSLYITYQVGNTVTDIADGSIIESKLSSDIVAKLNVEKGRKKHNAISYFNNKLELSDDLTIIQLIGDSTGNAENEWFVSGLMDYMQKYPDLQIVQTSWNIDNDSYADYKILRESASLPEPYTRLEKATGMYCSLDYENNNFDIDDDLEISIKFSIDDFSAGNEGVLVSRFGSPRSWAIALNSSKIPYFWYSTDGSTLVGSAASTGATEPLPTLNGEVVYLKMTIDVDNGASGNDINWYYSTNDGATWIKLGNTITRSGTTTVFNGTSDIIINGRGTPPWDMNFYKLIVRNGINGEVIASPNAILQQPRNNGLFIKKDMQGNIITCNSPVTQTRTGANTLLIKNASSSGMSLVYSMDSDRFEKQNKNEPDLLMISYSHNAGGDPNYSVNYPLFIDNLKTKYQNLNIIPVTQNPKTGSNSVVINAHKERLLLVGKIAAEKNLMLLDAFKAFMDTGDLDTYVSSDNTHPADPIGNKLWADLFVEMLTNSGGTVSTGGSSEVPDGVIVSDSTGITGATAINNIVSISQEDYDNLTEYDATTIYYII